MHPRQFDIPAPSDDNFFMDLCAEIYGREWKTDTVQVNGRSGQAQAGVDVQGRPNNGPDWYGIQCKARSRQGTRKPKLSEAEIRKEVDRALGFKPALKHLIIATSAPHDTVAQTVAREITEDHLANGLFSVDVLGWSEIRRRMDRYPEVHDWYQSLGPLEHRLETKVDAVGADVSSALAEIKATVAKGDPKLIEKLIDAQIDIARELVEAHRPHAAIQMLQGILDVANQQLAIRLRYRILSNLGNAHALLFDSSNAGQLFLKAAEFAPDNDKAAAQHALGHLLCGDLDATERVARDAAIRFPDSGRPQAILLAVANQLGNLEDPAAAVPAAFQANPNVAFTVANVFAQHGDYDHAAEWIKVGHANDPDDWQQRKAYAEFLLQRAVGSNRFLFGGSIELGTDFESARVELERIWDVVRVGEPIEASASIAAQVAIARNLSGDCNGARQACDAGLAMGVHPPPLLRIAAQLAEDDRRFEDVIDLLNKVDTKYMPERDMMIASAQIELGRKDDAVRSLAALTENSGAEPALRAAARARSIELRTGLGGDRDRLAEALDLVESDPEVVVYRVVASWMHERLEDHESALEQAHAASNLLGEAATVNDQVMVADLLVDLNETDDAVEIYTRLAPDPVDSKFGRQLLKALFVSDRRASLRTRLDAMPASEKTDPFYVWIEAALLERIGKLAEATDLLAAYLEHLPDSTVPRLNWIAFLERQAEIPERIAELRTYLEKNADLANGTPIQQLQYAHVLRRHGRTAEALHLGYETARHTMQDPGVNLAYMGLILSISSFKPFDQDTVQSDQGFVFKPEDGSPPRNYVIETGEIFDQGVAIPPNHPVARAAMGKRAGDELEFDAGPYSRTIGHIVSVRHKYLMLNDNIMENFNQRFPDHTGMFKVSIRGIESANPDISDFKKALDDQHSYAESMADQYGTKQLPLPVMAYLLGEHPIRTWGKLSTHGRDGIVTCLGNAEEIDGARKLLRTDNSGLMVDPITLCLINVLNLKEPLAALGRPLGVTRSTIESVESYIEELSRHSDGMKSLGKQGDQYVFSEVPAEEMRTYLNGLKDLVAWANTHCEEVSAIAESDLPPEMRRLADHIDRSFMDTIVAARGGSWILLSDDLHFRRLAKGAEVDGVWMQPVLEMALERGALNEDTYQDAVIKLALMNHNFTPLSEKTLLHAAEQDGWQDTPRQKKLLEITCGPTVEMPSMIRVLANFFFGVLDSGAPLKARRQIFATALKAFEKHHVDAVFETHKQLRLFAELTFDKKSRTQARRHREWKEHIYTWLGGLKRG